MLNLKKVAVTGGLSSGKSSVCRILKDCGAYIISADEIVHQLLSSDTNLSRAVVELLGRRILVKNQISRSRVAEIVFQDSVLLQALEDLLHPSVYNEMEKEYRKQQDKGQPPFLFVAEIPLLFESRGDKGYDFTLAVVADHEICFRRFTERKKFGREDFERRAARQLPMLEKAKRAQYVLMNNGSLENLRELTEELYRELIEDV